LVLALATAPALSQLSSVDAPFGLGTSFGLLLVYVLLALFISLLRSMAEAVLSSITPFCIAQLRERDPKQAARLQDLKGDGIARSLAAVVTVNNIAQTVGATGAGAKAIVTPAPDPLLQHAGAQRQAECRGRLKWAAMQRSLTSFSTVQS
jgi:hypothetical protein